MFINENTGGHLLFEMTACVYNCISHSVEVDGVDPSFNPETVKSDLHIIVHDQLKRKYQCDRGLVADLLGVLAGKHRYNPVEVMLKNAPAWDGVDRVEQLYKILCIEDDELSKTLREIANYAAYLFDNLLARQKRALLKPYPLEEGVEHYGINP